MSDRHGDILLLIDAVCEGRETNAQRAELWNRMRADPEIRKLYSEYMTTHAELAWKMRDANAASATNPLAKIDNRKTNIAVPLAIAAVLLAACGLATFFFVFNTTPTATPDRHGDVPVATLIETDTTVVVNNDIGNPGDDYAAGEYSIESGGAQFMLTNQVTVDMRGRTRLMMHGNMRASIARGNVTFKCPPGAKGYTVDLPGGSRVVDLGTEFEIDVDDNGGSVVWVREGIVRLERVAAIAADAPPITLTVDRVAHLGVAGSDEPVATGRRVLIAPGAIVQTAGDTLKGFDAKNLIDETGFDAEPRLRDLGELPAAADGDGASRGMWVTARSLTPNYFRGDANPHPRFVLRFDRRYEFTALVVWGYGGNTNEASDFVVEFSTDGGATWSPDEQTVATDRLLGHVAANLRFDRIRSADAVRLTITNNASGRGFPGVGGDRVGLGAIRFVGDRLDLAEAQEKLIEERRDKDAVEILNPGTGR